MAQKRVEAYDTRTGAKLPHRVPENWLRIFPYLSLTPKTKAAQSAASDDAPAAVPAEDVASTPKTARHGRQTHQKES